MPAPALVVVTAVEAMTLEVAAVEVAAVVAATVMATTAAVRTAAARAVTQSLRCPYLVCSRLSIICRLLDALNVQVMHAQDLSSCPYGTLQYMCSNQGTVHALSKSQAHAVITAARLPKHLPRHEWDKHSHAGTLTCSESDAGLASNAEFAQAWKDVYEAAVKHGVGVHAPHNFDNNELVTSAHHSVSV